MAVILLGPQSPESNLRQQIEERGINGPIVVITAGWRDSEGEIDDLREEVGRPVENLMIYHRAEEIFAREPELLELKRERQDKLRELQDLYRIRLAPTMAAATKLMRTHAEPSLLRVEQHSAIAQVRALDRHHLRRIDSIHNDFDKRRARLQIPHVIAERDVVHQQIEKAGLVLIAGGHVAVLLNRLRLFQLGDLLRSKPIIAWSAGAMALSERIVLFHHNAPQGKRDAEVLDVGLGIVQQMVPLPDAKIRLDLGNRKRMALFSRRFSPATCCTLDSQSQIRIEHGKITAASRSSVIMRSGRTKALNAR